jgi:hypothetical protein
VKDLERQGLLGQIRSSLSDATRQAIDSGNAAPRWIDGSVFDDLLCRLVSSAGREAAFGLGHRAMHGGAVGVALQPLISFVLSHWADPAALFARANGMAAIVSQGTLVSWTPKGERRGTLRLQCEEPVPDASWAAWEGALSYAFDLTGTSGAIGPTRILDAGKSCEAEVTWSPKGGRHG